MSQRKIFLKWCFTCHLVPEYLIYFLISFLTPCTTQQWVVLTPWVWVFTRDLFVVNFKLYFLVFRWDTCVREYGLIWSYFWVLLRKYLFFGVYADYSADACFSLFHVLYHLMQMFHCLYFCWDALFIGESRVLKSLALSELVLIYTK